VHPLIYVSSTSEDLSAERLRVISALNRVKLIFEAMEFYGADSRGPLERCRADVRASHLYIGMIGWRYGSCPHETPGISYTRNEYLTAKEAGIPRLIYLKQGEPPAGMAPDDPVLEFRREAQESGVVCGKFSNEADLAESIFPDVKRELERLAPQDEYCLVPYLYDRADQTTELVSEIADAGRIAVCLIHGRHNQSVTKFIDCVRELYLPGYLGQNRAPVQEHQLQLQWIETPERMARSIRLALATKLQLDIRTAPVELERLVQEKIVAHPGPILIRCQLPARGLSGQVERLRALLAYFTSWNPPAGHPGLLVVLWLEYPGGWCAKLAAFMRRTSVKEACASASTAERKIGVIREFGDVSASDAAHWLGRDEVRRYVRDRDIDGPVKGLFQKRNPMPMDELAPKLLQILNGGGAK
jgi:hypothetical protein